MNGKGIDLEITLKTESFESIEKIIDFLEENDYQILDVLSGDIVYQKENVRVNIIEENI